VHSERFLLNAKGAEHLARVALFVDPSETLPLRLLFPESPIQSPTGAVPSVVCHFLLYIAEATSVTYCLTLSLVFKTAYFEEEKD
jgi:hypothetical protein